MKHSDVICTSDLVGGHDIQTSSSSLRLEVCGNICLPLYLLLMLPRQSTLHCTDIKCTDIYVKMQSPSWVIRPIKWTPVYTVRPQISRKCITWGGMSVYAELSLVVTVPTLEGMARLSWPGRHIQIAAKPLRIVTWLLLTAYRNLPIPHPTVPSPTHYNVPFNHSK